MPEWLTCFPAYAFLLCSPPGREDDCLSAFQERGLEAAAVGRGRRVRAAGVAVGRTAGHGDRPRRQPRSRASPVDPVLESSNRRQPLAPGSAGRCSWVGAGVRRRSPARPPSVQPSRRKNGDVARAGCAPSSSARRARPPSPPRSGPAEPRPRACGTPTARRAGRPASGPRRVEQEQPDGAHGDPVAVAQHGDRRVIRRRGSPGRTRRTPPARRRRPGGEWPDGRRVRSRSRARRHTILRAARARRVALPGRGGRSCEPQLRRHGRSGPGGGPICRRAWTLCSPEHAWHRAQPALATSAAMPRSLM